MIFCLLYGLPKLQLKLQSTLQTVLQPSIQRCLYLEQSSIVSAFLNCCQSRLFSNARQQIQFVKGISTTAIPPCTLISGANLPWLCGCCTSVSLQQSIILRAQPLPLVGSSMMGSFFYNNTNAQMPRSKVFDLIMREKYITTVYEEIKSYINNEHKHLDMLVCGYKVL